MNEKPPNEAGPPPLPPEPDHRLDGIANLLSEIGGAKDRSRAFRTSANEVRLDRDSLDIHYEDDHYAKKVIDIPPEDCVKEGFTIKVEDSEDVDPFGEIFVDMGVVDALEQADKFARLYGGAAIILGAEDGQDFDTPLNMNRIQSFDWLMVVDRHALQSGALLENNPRAKFQAFGRPTHYTLNLSGSVASAYSHEPGERALDNNTVIHASRMIRLYGDSVAFHRRSHYDHWAAPVLNRVFTAMSNLMACEAGISNLIQTYSQAIFKKKDLARFVQGADGRAKLIELFTIMNMSQSILNMMIVDQGEEFTRQTINVAGLADLISTIANSYAAAADMPISKIFGTANGSLSSDDKAGSENYNARIAARQRKVYLPALTRIAKTLAHSKDFKEVDASTEIYAEVNAQEGITEKERADTFKTYSEAAATLIDRGVLRPSEVRKSFFGGAGFNPDIVLEDEVDTTFAEVPAGVDPLTAVIEDANTDPPEKRAARRRVQTLVENGTLKPVSQQRCKDCGKPASEYDHIKGYKDKKAFEKVEPVCASCHHIRTNKRKK